MTREERTKLIKHLKYNRSIGADYVITDKDTDEIIKSLEQKSKYKKEAKRWKNKALRQRQVLDKIKAEIKELATFDTVDVLVEVNRIIDKYRAESEEEK